MHMDIMSMENEMFHHTLLVNFSVYCDFIAHNFAYLGSGSQGVKSKDLLVLSYF